MWYKVLSMDVHQANDDLRSIREIMERSVRSFHSAAGQVCWQAICLAGAAYAYNRLYLPTMKRLHLRSELIRMSTMGCCLQP